MSVLTLPLAKEHLNIAEDETEHDDELRDMIDAAEGAIARRVGPLEPTVVTERIGGRGNALALSTTPVVSITTVTPYGGVATDGEEFYLDEGGLLSFLDSRRFSCSTYDVAYIAGRNEVPPDLLMAIKAMVKHLWRSQRGAATRRTRENSGGEQPSLTYAIPNAVVELIEPYVQPVLA